jgi:hypothetical protein
MAGVKDKYKTLSLQKYSGKQGYPQTHKTRSEGIAMINVSALRLIVCPSKGLDVVFSHTWLLLTSLSEAEYTRGPGIPPAFAHFFFILLSALSQVPTLITFAPPRWPLLLTLLLSVLLLCTTASTP